jgi:hypothetical protein
MVITPPDNDPSLASDAILDADAIPSAPIAEADATLPPASSASPAATAGPANLVSTPPDLNAAAPGTAEIPATMATQPSQDHSPNPIGSQPIDDSQASGDAQSSPDAQAPNDVARYEAEQAGLPPDRLQQQGFGNDGELTTPFGMHLREARRELKSGEGADGLLITAVTKGSPAANAGLHAYSHVIHDALTGAAIVGALVPGGQFAILLIPMIDYMKVGESYDMIIGIDGSRVTSFLDFQDHMRDLQPGEIVYLSVLRDGKRIQVTLPVTADTAQASTN